MSRRMRVLGIVMLGAVAPACTMLAGLTDDYAYKPGGPSNDGGGDGNVDQDGALPDGFVPPQDGGMDVKADQVGADAGTFCDQHPVTGSVVYCWDFEDTAVNQTTWGWDDSQTSSATLAVENGMGVGGSRALHAVIAAAGASGSSGYIRKQLPGQFNDFQTQVLSFAFSVKKKSTLYTATIGAIGYGASLKYMGLSVYSSAGTDLVDVSDPPGGLLAPSESAAVDTWHRAIITLSRTSPGNYSSVIEVETNGTKKTVDPSRAFVGGTAPTEIVVGAFFSSQPGTVETAIDDVLVVQTK